MFPKPRRIVICVDPDGCNDDCAALVMLLRSGLKHAIDGVIVTSGNTWAEAGRRALTRVLAAAGVSPAGPILVSEAGPLVHSSERAQMARNFWGVDYSGAFDQPATAAPSGPGPAQAFLQGIVHRYPGEVTIVSLAPMTPLALAIGSDPSFAADVGEIVIMAGSIGAPGNATPHAEFNAWFDPEAARTVFRSAIRRKIVFDLYACEQAIVTWREFEVIAGHNTPFTHLYRDHMGNSYPGFLSNPTATVPMWDALVAVYLIDPSVVHRFDDMVLDVDVEFGPTYGVTRQVEPSDGAHILRAAGIDGPRALELYCALLSEGLGMPPGQEG